MAVGILPNPVFSIDRCAGANIEVRAGYLADLFVNVFVELFLGFRSGRSELAARRLFTMQVVESELHRTQNYIQGLQQNMFL